MSGLIAQLFVTPMALSGLQKAALILPLCLGISLVYKATRLADLRSLVRAATHLWITIVVGMYAVGFALWLLYRLMV